MSSEDSLNSAVTLNGMHNNFQFGYTDNHNSPSNNYTIDYQDSKNNVEICDEIETKFLAICHEIDCVLPKWEQWLQRLSNYLTDWKNFNHEDIPSELANSSKMLIYELNTYFEIACNNLNDLWILVEWSKLGRNNQTKIERDVIWELVYDLYSRCGRIIDCENHPYLECITEDFSKECWASIILNCRPDLVELITTSEEEINQSPSNEISIKTNNVGGIPNLPIEAVFDKSVRDIEAACDKLEKENKIKTILITAKSIIDDSPFIKLPSINSQARGALKRTLMQYKL